MDSESENYWLAGPPFILHLLKVPRTSEAAPPFAVFEGWVKMEIRIRKLSVLWFEESRLEFVDQRTKAEMKLLRDSVRT
jgi:hypothetical protein